MEGHYGNLGARSRAARTTSDLHLTWDVPYEPGTLKAVGTKDGKIAATMEISTTGDAARIHLVADRSSLIADRRDVVHVAVEITDGQGRLVPAAISPVSFEIEGEGRLIGVDNGDPRSHEGFKAKQRSAFNGLCLAIVQSTAKAGTIIIRASSQTLESDALTILSKA
jgi:beta-galactosidase